MLITILSFLTIFNFSQPQPLLAPIPSSQMIINQEQVQPKEEILFQSELDLSLRDSNFSVNKVFAHNILLAVSHLFPGRAWNTQDGPGKNEFILNSKETFAFHPNILSSYKNEQVLTSGDEFSSQEGYLSAGGITGDGVCHLASFLNWASHKAGLETQALVDHSFRSISGVPKEYWTSIRYAKSGHNSQKQNLYIKNNFDFPIIFQFQTQGNLLILKVMALRNN